MRLWDRSGSEESMSAAGPFGGHASRLAREAIGTESVTGMLSPFLMNALLDGDLALRSAVSEAIGRLDSLPGTNYLTSQIKNLMDQVVNNHNPNGIA